MRNLRLLPLICLTLAFFMLSSCVSKKKWTELMSDKEQLDLMLSQTQDQVKSLEKDVSTLSDEKAKLEDDFNKETVRLNNEISGIQTDLQATKKANEEMQGMIAVKDAKIQEITAAVKAPFNSLTQKGVQLQEKGSGVYVSNPVRFKSGSARLTEESKAAIQSLVDALMSNPAVNVVVEGHTDDVPMKEGAPYADNMALSKARANSVVKQLVKMGVNPAQLVAVGFGSTKPVMTTDEGVTVEDARSSNRRAEISILTSPTELFKLSQSL